MRVEVELERPAKDRRGDQFGMFAEPPFAADDHLDVDSESEDERRQDGPVVPAELIAMEAAGKEACEDHQGGDDAEDEGRDGESVGDVSERLIMAEKWHVQGPLLSAKGSNESKGCMIRLRRLQYGEGRSVYLPLFKPTL